MNLSRFTLLIFVFLYISAFANDSQTDSATQKKIHERQPTEQYNLYEYTIVEVMRSPDKEPSIKVIGPEGKQFELHKGDYIGRHIGKIVHISPTDDNGKADILVREIHRQKNGRWVERELYIDSRPIEISNLDKAYLEALRLILIENDSYRGPKMLLMLAKQGYVEAQYMLGRLHHEGVFVSRDNVQAYAWFDIAAANRNEYAIFVRNDIAKWELSPEEVSESNDIAKKFLEKYGAKE